MADDQAEDSEKTEPPSAKRMGAAQEQGDRQGHEPVPYEVAGNLRLWSRTEVLHLHRRRLGPDGGAHEALPAFRFQMAPSSCFFISVS